MSWSLSVPKKETTEEFIDALWTAKEAPKADKRTKAGKAQAFHVTKAKDALSELAGTFGATAGSASGHVAPDLSATLSINLTIPAPE